MSIDWYPGIRAFCLHWKDAQTLQDTFQTLETEFAYEHDGCIDAAKGIVECACRIIIDELDDPQQPLKPQGTEAPIHALVGVATRLLKLSDIRHRKFADLIKHHNNLTASLRELRNEAGTVSHGKDGFIERLSVHHRRSAVLSADAIITFLHQAYLEAELDLRRTREPYDRFTSFHEQIDAQASIEAEVDGEGLLNVTVSMPNGDRLPLLVEPSRLLYALDRDAYVEALNAARSAPPPIVVEDEQQGAA